VQEQEELAIIKENKLIKETDDYRIMSKTVDKTEEEEQDLK